MKKKNMTNPFDNLPDFSPSAELLKYHKIINSFVIRGYDGVHHPELEYPTNMSNKVAIYILFEENNFIDYSGLHNAYRLRYLTFSISVFNNGEIYLLQTNDYQHKVSRIYSPKDVITFMTINYNYTQS